MSDSKQTESGDRSHGEDHENPIKPIVSGLCMTGPTLLPITVMASDFAIFFKQYWSQDVAHTHSTFYLGVGKLCRKATVIVILAPILGAMADTGGLRKRMLATFASLGVLATGSLYLVQAAWRCDPALCHRSGRFFRRELPAGIPCWLLSPRSDIRVSALGFALGYLGGGLLFR